MTRWTSCCEAVTAEAVSAAASALSALVALAALVYVGRQVRIARDQREAAVAANEAAERSVRGQFLLQLDQAFASHSAVHRKLIPGLGVWGRDEGAGPLDDDLPDVTAYMGLLERVMVMVDDRLLDVGIVSRLYGYRVGNLCGNRRVACDVLARAPEEWTDFLRLVRLLGGSVEASLASNWAGYRAWRDAHEHEAVTRPGTGDLQTHRADAG